MYESVVLATWFGGFEFSRNFWHFGNLNLTDFLTFGEFQFEFPALFVEQEEKRKSAGKFKFAESCSEYHHFIHFLCFIRLFFFSFFQTFFFSKNFQLQKVFPSDFSSTKKFFGNIFAIFWRFLGGVGQRSEPPAGGLAPAAEGGVSASYW